MAAAEPMTPGPGNVRPAWWWALLRLRCPNCRKGAVFFGVMSMHQQCPRCRYVFEREPGYFLGAIAIGYFLGVAVVCAVAVLLYLAWPSVGWEWAFSLGLVGYLLVTPVVFRYARVAWMYADNWLDPPAE